MQRRQERSGFTLIELLVVVSILALLISILLPSLGAARSQAKTVKCGAQLRQFGTAARYYAGEQGGWVPGNYFPTYHSANHFSEGGRETPNVLFAEVLAPYLGGPSKAVLSAQGNSNESRDCPLSQMFARMSLLKCPAWPEGRDPGGNTCPTGGVGRGRGGGGGVTEPRQVEITAQVVTYVVNGWDYLTEKRSLGPDGFSTLADGPSPPRGIIQLERVPTPSKLVFLTEAHKDNLSWKAYGTHDIWRRAHLWDSIDSRILDDLRHASGRGKSVERAKANILYYDGHVAPVQLASIDAHDFSPYQPPRNLRNPPSRGR